MNHSASPALLKSARIQRHYQLPGETRVLVSEGELVQENQMIIQTVLPSLDILSIPIAQSFHVSPTAAIKTLRVRPGQQVLQGELLASHRRWFTNHQIVSPADIVVGHYDRGTLYLHKQHEPTSAVAALPGLVVSVSERNYITIETKAAFISGAWRRGSAAGKLLLAQNLPGPCMLPEDISEEHEGCILVGGCLSDIAVLKRAQMFHLAGVVASSMPPNMVESFAEYHTPLMLIVGLGEHTLSGPLLKTLQELEGMQAYIEAAPPYSDHAIIIPVDQSAPANTIELRFEMRPGTLVRILRGPHHGETATIVAPGKQRLAHHNSTVVAGAEVRLSSGRIAFLPEVNLQLIYDRTIN